MLTETYRPKTWADVVGQDKVIKQIDGLRKRGLTGRAYWLSGKSGTGKTTIARLLAGDVASEWDTEEIDAQSLTTASLREMERLLAYRGMTGAGGKAIIVNEAHGLRRDVIRQLLVSLERIPGHATWTFTTTNDGQGQLFEDYDDAGPLLSRCLPLKLTEQGLAEPFAQSLWAIAQAIGVAWDLKKCMAVIRECGNNLRAAIQRLELA